MWSHNNRTINRFSTRRLLEKFSPLLKIPSLAQALSRHLLVASGPTRPLSLLCQQRCQWLTITFNPSLSFTDPLSSFSWSPYGLSLLNHFRSHMCHCWLLDFLAIRDLGSRRGHSYLLFAFAVSADHHLLLNLAQVLPF